MRITKDFLSLGMGVQSSELALKAAHGELLPLGYNVSAAIFADTMAEPRSVYSWAEQLIEHVADAPHPFPIYIVSKGNLTSDSLQVIASKKNVGNLYQKNLIPLFMLGADGKRGILQRKCTSEYKIRAIQKKQKELIGSTAMNAWRRDNREKLRAWNAHAAEVKKSRRKIALLDPKVDFGIPPICRTLIGISTDEVQRVKASREAFSENLYPLIEIGMSRSDCIADQIARLGRRAPRSACKYCPYHSDDEWIRIRDEEPEEFAESVAFDHALREANGRDNVTRGIPYLHDSRVPLDMVTFKPGVKKEGDDFEAHCEAEGMCGL